MQAIPIPRRRTTHDATSTSPHPSPPYRNLTNPAATTAASRRHLDMATPTLTCPHPAASPPTTSPLQSPPPQLAAPAPTCRKPAKSAAATAAATRRRHHCPHPAASPPTPPTPMPPRRHHFRPHPADAATNATDSTLTPPQPPPLYSQATHLAAASTQSHPHPAASAPHLLPHFPSLHPSYYIVAACTFISYIILHE